MSTILKLSPGRDGGERVSEACQRACVVGRVHRRPRPLKKGVLHNPTGYTGASHDEDRLFQDVCTRGTSRLLQNQCSLSKASYPQPHWLRSTARMNRSPINLQTQPTPSTAPSQGSHWHRRVPSGRRRLRDSRTHAAAPQNKTVNPTHPDRQPNTTAATAMNAAHRGKPWKKGANAPGTEARACCVILDVWSAEDAALPPSLSAGSGGMTAGSPSTSPSPGSTGGYGSPSCSCVTAAGAAENPAPSHASAGGDASGWMSKPLNVPASAAGSGKVLRLLAPGRPRERRGRAMEDNRGGGGGTADKTGEGEKVPRSSAPCSREARRVVLTVSGDSMCIAFVAKALKGARLPCLGVI